MEKRGSMLRHARHFSVRLIWLLLTSIVIGVVTATVIYTSSVKDTQSQVVAEHNRFLSNKLSQFNSSLGDIEHTMTLLGLQLSSVMNKTNSLDENPLLLSDLLETTANAIDQIDQIRLLDTTGFEKIRFDRKESNVVKADSTALQDKSSRYYFINALKTPPASIYVSPIDLNVENDQVEVPYKPMLRAALKLYAKDTSQLLGMVVVNYKVQSLLVEDEITNHSIDYFLLDEEGYWLVNPDKELEWGKDLKRYHATLAELDPFLYDLIQGKEDFVGFNYHDTVMTLATVNFEIENDSNNTLRLMTVSSKAYLAELTHPALVSAIFIGLTIALALSIVAILDDLARKQKEEFTEALKTSNLRLEKALEEQTQLEGDLVESQKMAALGNMVAGIAHELNTPLGGAIITADQIEKELGELKSMFPHALSQHYLETYLNRTQDGMTILTSNLNRASQLLKSFKSLALDRANNDIINFELSPLIHDLINALEPQLKKAGITASLQLDDSIAMSSYPGAISSSIENIINNAIDHAYEASQYKKVMISTRTKADFIYIDVQDNGIGIDERIEDKLFDPFVTTRRHKGNTGLGLHQVHQWVYTVLKGKISVQSNSNGTIFTLVLPKKLEKIHI
jgi:signal transduction histidine kinase